MSTEILSLPERFRNGLMYHYDDELNGSEHLVHVFSDRKMLLAILKDRNKYIHDAQLHRNHFGEHIRAFGQEGLKKQFEEFAYSPDFKVKTEFYNPMRFGSIDTLESALYIIPVYEQFIKLPESTYSSDLILRQCRKFLHVQKAELSSQNYYLKTTEIEIPAIEFDRVFNQVLLKFISEKKRFPSMIEQDVLLSLTCQTINDKRLCVDLPAESSIEQEASKRKVVRFFHTFPIPLFGDYIPSDIARIGKKYGSSFINNPENWLYVGNKIYDNRKMTHFGKILTLESQRNKR